jgi:pyridoxine 5'-phosphate synthase PdxJ
VELNIGHAIVSRAVTAGLAAAVTDLLALLAPYPP